jgi:exopolysaccharide biosynthesis polyprenyl glycosylphosphotransferase
MATIGLETLSKQSNLPSKFSLLSSLNIKTASRSKVIAVFMMIVDIICVFVALIWAYTRGLERLLGSGESLSRLALSGIGLSWQIGYLLWFTVTLLLAAHHHGLYGSSLNCSTLKEQRKTVQACLTAGLLLCGAMYLMHNPAIPRAVVIYLVCLTTCFLCISRAAWRYFAIRRYERGLDLRNVLIVGANRMGIALSKQIQKHRHSGRIFKGFVEAPGKTASEQVPAEQIVGSIEELRNLARQHFIDEIIIADPCSAMLMLNMVEFGRECKLEVLVIPEACDEIIPVAPVEYIGELPVVSIHRRNERALASLVKRMTDICLSSFILLLLLPALFVIALIIRLDSPGPVLYRSERIGKKGRVFPCFKFRTMVMNAEKMKDALASRNERSGILFKMKNDPRITKIGRILRKYSLDEIPQLLNVLRGEMSLVGPRPPIASEVQQYELEHLRRLEVLPGLTGLWQVRARQDPSFERYVALDLAYVENWSASLDMRILLRTAKVVIHGTGS